MYQHIWIFNHYAIGPDISGGTRHYSLARELVRKGYDVTIFASNWNHLQKKMHRLQDGRLWDVEIINGVKFVWLRSFPYDSNNWRRVLNILSYSSLALLIGLVRPSKIVRPDIIIGSSVHLLAAFVARLLAWSYHTQYIVEIRDLWPQTLIDAGIIAEKGFWARFMRMFELFLYRNSDHIVTLLPAASEYICQQGIPREKVTWIPNGIDPSAYPEVFCNMEKQRIRSTFDIFYTGNHGIYDGLDTVLECALLLQKRNIKHIKFVFVGNGVAKPQLITKAKNHKLANVEFRDPVPKNLVPEILGEADACILVNKDLPLYKYGISSNKLFDYLAAGKPVIIVGDVAGNIVAAAQCGVTVQKEDPVQLTMACLELAEMDSLKLYHMGRNGREHVFEKYSFEYLTARLECVMNQTIHPHVW